MTPKAEVTVPSTDDPVELADWLETYMLASGHVVVSRSLLRARLRVTLFMDAGSGPADLDPDDLEVAIESVLLEVARRRRLCAGKYPFVECGTGLSIDRDCDALGYVFLLLLAASPAPRSSRRLGNIERSFDLLVLNALKQYLGPRSDGLRFGWPPSDGRPKNFPAALDWLARSLGLPRGNGHARVVSKDGGVDVVAWLPWSDRRSAFIVVLGQCTVQRDWFPKGKDVIPDVWRGYIDFGKDPSICLAIPFVIPPDFERWDELRRTVHIILDRIRITEALEELDPELRRDIADWVNSELGRIGSLNHVIADWLLTNPDQRRRTNGGAS